MHQIKETPIKNNKAFVTTDKDLIKQYYELRNSVFRDEEGLTHEKWTKTDHDDGSEIAVCVVDGKVVGGLKIFISKNGELLSEEYEGTEYVYSNLIKRMNLDCDKRYAELVDLVVEKKFRNGGLVKKLIAACNKNVAMQNCSYVFYIASLEMCSLYRRHSMSFDEKLIIFDDLFWLKSEEYNNSMDHPCMVIL